MLVFPLFYNFDIRNSYKYSFTRSYYFYHIILFDRKNTSYLRWDRYSTHFIYSACYSYNCHIHFSFDYKLAENSLSSITSRK